MNDGYFMQYYKNLGYKLVACTRVSFCAEVSMKDPKHHEVSPLSRVYVGDMMKLDHHTKSHLSFGPIKSFNLTNAVLFMFRGKLVFQV